MNSFHASIVTPEQIVYDGEVFSLIVPGEAGYLGVLAQHAPLIANLVPGTMTLKEKGGRTREISLKTKGFIEVLQNKATILVDNVDPSQLAVPTPV